MDPNRTLLDLLDAVNEGAIDVAQERLIDLLEWRAKGGFAPNVGWCLDELRRMIHQRAADDMAVHAESDD